MPKMRTLFPTWHNTKTLVLKNLLKLQVKKIYIYIPLLIIYISFYESYCILKMDKKLIIAIIEKFNFFHVFSNYPKNAVLIEL